MTVAKAPTPTPGQTPPTKPPHGPTHTAALGIQLNRRSLIKLGVIGGIGLAVGLSVKECADLPEVDEIEEPKDKDIQALITRWEQRLRGDNPDGRALENGFARSGGFHAFTVEAFADAGLPPELADLAFAESGWTYAATSSANAHGLYQFMPRTARIDHAMEVQGRAFDERRDPIQSAEGAARYLKRLFRHYDSFRKLPVPDAWYWALTAYNAGEGNIDPHFRRTHGKYAKYFDQPMNRESQGYVAKFFAYRRVVKTMRAEGAIAQLEQVPPLDGVTVAYKQTFTTIRVKSGQTLSHIAATYGTTVAEIARVNGLRKRRGKLHLRAGQRLRIPNPMERISVGELLDVTGGTLKEFFARNIAASPNHVGRATVLPSGLRVYVAAGEGDDLVSAFADRLENGKHTDIRTFRP